VTLDQSVPSADLTIPAKYNNPYVLLITSYNSTYSILVGGTWAQFTDISLGVYWGGTLILVGIAMYYYYRVISQRDAMFRKALEDAKRETPG
jgi:hypothetical protein